MHLKKVVWQAMVETVNPTEHLAFVNKDLIRRIIKEQNQKAGFVPDPTASAEKAQSMILALGVRPEDNQASREIITERERQ